MNESHGPMYFGLFPEPSEDMRKALEATRKAREESGHADNWFIP